MLALGLLSFQSSNRFIMYLAPFIGIGLGWLLQLVGIEGVLFFDKKVACAQEDSGKNKPTDKGAKKNVKIFHNGKYRDFNERGRTLEH